MDIYPHQAASTEYHQNLANRKIHHQNSKSRLTLLGPSYEHRHRMHGLAYTTSTQSHSEGWASMDSHLRLLGTRRCPGDQVVHKHPRPKSTDVHSVARRQCVPYRMTPRVPPLTSERRSVLASASKDSHLRPWALRPYRDDLVGHNHHRPRSIICPH